jgi:hypothetical protein
MGYFMVQKLQFVGQIWYKKQRTTTSVVAPMFMAAVPFS